MKRLSLQVWIGWILILISLFLLIWGFYPFEQKRREMRISPQEMHLPSIHEVIPYALCWA